jgi:succinyl-CoA synthetase beta subunit
MPCGRPRPPAASFTRVGDFDENTPPSLSSKGIQLNLHEYQSKALFAEYGIPVPEGRVVQSPQEAARAAHVLGGDLWVVKAQVHAGGRGKAGGVKLSRSVDEVEEHAKAMLGSRLVTHQTGAEGLPIDHVYVEAGSDIAR